MHGRMKVRSTEEQEEIKKKERQEKAIKYRAATQRIYQKRASGDTDNEALQLTKDVLSVNPEITSLWNYRREVIQHREKNTSPQEFSELCEDELGLLERCLRVNPKAYCVWQHREWVMQNTPTPDWAKEKRLCDLFLKYDERNFHCWDYRRHVISKSACVSPSQELEFTYDKIAANFSNYSSWHYRSKLLPVVYPGGAEGPISEEALLREHELAQNAFFTDPDDQSAWFYHRWLLGEVASSVKIDLVYVSHEDPQPVVYIIFNQPLKLYLPLLVETGGHCTSVKGADWPVALYQCPVSISSIIMVSYGQQHISLSDSSQCWVNEQGLLAQSSTKATLSVLTTELDNCQQLLQEEPNNKWCLLTTMLLMQSLDPHHYSTEIKDKARLLMTVDPYRKNYYSHLLSQFVIKETLREALPQLLQSDHVLDLTAKGLSILDHTEYFVPYHTVLLANNCLTRLPDQLVWPAIHTLILDDNGLETLPPSVGHMKSLQTLSVKNNNICSLCAVETGLVGLTALSVLHLQGNPLCKDPRQVEALKQNLPKLTDLNTIG